MQGLTPDSPVVVDSVREEYGWLDANFPGYRMLEQRLVAKAGRQMDVISILAADGRELDVFFDISGFIGKTREP